MEENLVLSQSEYEHLLEEIHKLQARITELTALRDDLVYHICPALRAEYDEKIVSLERELMAANMYLKQMQRTIEILQAQINQRQEPSMEKAEAQAKEENKEYEEDLNRKAEEARSFKKKWEESQWSKHDRQEKETREKENQEKKEKSDAQSNASDSSKGDNSGDTGRTGASEDEENRSRKKETVSEKIKRLYRKIVKRLHPDVHPNLTEHEKELWNRAVKAQQEGDLGALERIWDELSGMDAPEDVYDDSQEGRQQLRELLEKLKIRLQLLELEIEHIKTEFPYKLKSFLEDLVAVEEVRRGIQSKIDHVREMIRQLEAFIQELREKLQKGERL